MRKINSLLIDGTIISIHDDKKLNTGSTIIELVNAPVVKKGKLSLNTQVLNEHRFYVDIPKALLKKTNLELKVGDELRVVGYVKPTKLCAEHIALVQRG